VPEPNRDGRHPAAKARHIHWHRSLRGGIIAQLAVGIPAPAFHSTRRGDCASVVAACCNVADTTQVGSIGWHTAQPASTDQQCPEGAFQHGASTGDARSGQIVVARLGDEVTVKRLKRRGGRIELLAESPDYPPIVVNGPLAIDAS